ncbi:histidinol-phosphate transaminase [Vibrio sp. TH_r3]|uniref:histidinol-phosphate transaminase n=1 Tax=Vibrio sp. TH_r3 TaxID=3082084 RepID=UPI0029556EAF|nr:histidinol-phosphate transaminase [Vibrio sp. TH_r3]MDV7105614.1 histidinol-phosphate transaminase [Vibrio sp. TH_r3]
MKSMDEIVVELANKFVVPLNDYNAGLSVEALKAKYKVEKIAKLASNENPFGTPDSVKKVLDDQHNLAHYPDPTCRDLKSAIGQIMNVDEQKLIMGNGSEDIIAMISHAFIEVGDKVLTVVPSFGLHILYPKSFGAEMIIAPMTDDLQFDVNSLCRQLRDSIPKLFFIASPSNPVGCTLSKADIQLLLDSQHAQTLFVFDEAYYEYAVGGKDYPDVLALLQSSGKPFILLRTLSKAYSLAGLRVGYGVCASAKMVKLLNKIRLPFNVNRLAQKAAIAALFDAEHLDKTMKWNETAKQDLFEKLQKLGLDPAPSKGNFLFFKTAYPSTEIAEQLLILGVIVKAWAEPGYSNYLRVSIGSKSENEHFITSLATILHSKQDSKLK